MICRSSNESGCVSMIGISEVCESVTAIVPFIDVLLPPVPPPPLPVMLPDFVVVSPPPPTAVVGLVVSLGRVEVDVSMHVGRGSSHSANSFNSGHGVPVPVTLM